MDIYKNIVIFAMLFGAVNTTFAANYDLLGRAGSKKHTPMVFKNVDYQHVKTSALTNNNLVARQGLNDAAAISGKIATYSGGGWGKGDYYSYSKYSYSVITSANKKIQSTDTDNFETYRNGINKYFTPIELHNTQSSTSKQVESTKTGTTPTFSYTFDNSLAPRNIPQDDNGHNDLDWYLPSALRNASLVGVYISEAAEPTKKFSEDKFNFSPINSCSGKPSFIDEYHATEDAATVYYLSGNSIIYSHNTLCASDKYPSNPESKSPQVYIGIHNHNAHSDAKASSTYNDKAKALDNYIYNNHTIDFAAAGDFGGPLAEEAQSANAITVGATHFGDYYNRDYSSWYTTAYDAFKPEISNYTDFRYSPSYDNSMHQKKYNNNNVYSYAVKGTQGAAAHTAAIVSNLLSTEPFYRWHPEVIKAVLLTSNKKTILNPALEEIRIPWEQSIFAKIEESERCSNRRNRESRYWNGSWEKLSEVYDGERQIRFNVNPGYHTSTFRAAIAWLSSGDDIAAAKRIPQDFDLTIYDDEGNFIASSRSSYNPFEVVDFTHFGSFTVAINLFSDDSKNNRGKVQLGFSISEISDDAEWLCSVGF